MNADEFKSERKNLPVGFVVDSDTWTIFSPITSDFPVTFI
jgi:hypothetical protein